MTSAPGAFYGLFALDMQRVLIQELQTEFSRLEPAQLSEATVAVLQSYEQANPQCRKGIYVLDHMGEPSYVGKADTVLSERLEEHRRKLSARLNMNVAEITFRCIYLDLNWSALAHEGPLIEAFGSLWNDHGFGNHDPGRRRDRTELKPTHFDRIHPINPDIGLGFPVGEMPLQEALERLKSTLPYLFRFKTKDGGSAYADHVVEIARGETAKTLIGKAVDALGADWQVTFLCGYLILYPENHDYFPGSFLTMKRGGQAWRLSSDA